MQMAEEAQEGMRGKGVYIHVGIGNDKNSKYERREVQESMGKWHM